MDLISKPASWSTLPPELQERILHSVGYRKSQLKAASIAFGKIWSRYCQKRLFAKLRLTVVQESAGYLNELRQFLDSRPDLMASVKDLVIGCYSQGACIWEREDFFRYLKNLLKIWRLGVLEIQHFYEATASLEHLLVVMLSRAMDRGLTKLIFDRCRMTEQTEQGNTLDWATINRENGLTIDRLELESCSADLVDVVAYVMGEGAAHKITIIDDGEEGFDYKYLFGAVQVRHLFWKGNCSTAYNSEMENRVVEMLYALRLESNKLTSLHLHITFQDIDTVLIIKMDTRGFWSITETRAMRRGEKRNKAIQKLIPDNDKRCFLERMDTLQKFLKEDYGSLERLLTRMLPEQVSIVPQSDTAD
ncbi:hypothetical protein VKT23_019110 [Stygiomarasmius scandens]|uniref:F-box domain-containing protein n=1 Tax=Marasmiellus scandens TaxID=2682957 RepID=A0ABR1IMF8_9AGAR